MDDQNELFVVVDENDKILEYRTRHDCHHDKSLIHRAVGIVLVNDKGEIILQKRSQNKDTDPGKYDVAASGHVARSESYEQAAQREMQEELGVTASLTFVDKMVMRFPEETEFDAFFKAVHNGPFKINKDEIEELVFATEEDIRDNLYDLTLFAQKALKITGVV